MTSGIYGKLKSLSKDYALTLKRKINDRVEEMKGDDKSHYLIYRVLGSQSHC